LARSISTVIQEKRKRVGVLATDVKLFGGFDMSSMSSTPSALLVEELKKAFELVPVDASAPITERYDVLLAVQPSSLSPEQMDHFVAAVQSGQPTAIFEDPMPFPNWFPGVPGTNDPKQPGGGAMGMFGGQRPTPKGDIRKLWQTLGVDFSGGSVVWQDYNPYPRFTDILSREWVFLNRNMKDAQPFADGEPITKELQQLLFVFPGEITRLNSSPLKFTGLVRTGNATGTVVLSKASDPFSFGGPRINLQRIELAEVSTGELYTLAARIRGKLKTENAMMSDEPAGGAPAAADSPPAATVPAPAAAAAAEGGAGSAAAKPAGDHDHDHGPGHDHDHPHGNLPAVGAAAGKEAEINVILISDIDCLYGAFFHIRAQGDGDEDGSAMSFDNVTFVLNVLDDLAGEQGMIEIRSRRPAYRTLTKVNEATESAREEAEKNRTEYIKKFEESTRKAQEQLDAEVEKLRNRTDLSNEEKSEQLAILLRDVSLRKAAADEKAQRDRDRELRRIEQRLNTKVRSVQDTFKIWALLLPPIPPLLIGAAVFFSRRAREQEGVDQARLR
jgi:ABC-2 type transport system permease protein